MAEDTTAEEPMDEPGSVNGRGNGRSTVIYGTDDIAKHQYNMIENSGPLAEMSGRSEKNFYGGRYNVEILQEDRIMYRTGSSNIDSVYAIKIPKGTTIYTGPVSPQGSVYVGGYDVMQTFIELPEKFEIVAKIILK